MPSLLDTAIDHLQAGRLAQAEAALRRAVQRDPRDAQIHGFLGVVLASQHRHDQAEFAFKRAIDLDPRNPTLRINYGGMLALLGRAQEASDLLEPAMRERPDVVDGHASLALARHTLRNVEGAVESASTAHGLSGGEAFTAVNLASALVAAGRPLEALRVQREAITRPEASADLIANYLYTLHYDPGAKPDFIEREHLRLGPCIAAFQQGLPPTLRISSNSARPLRVGYLSADFRRHSVAAFVEALLRHHDRTQFHITAYFSSRPDAETGRLRALCDQWREVASLSDAELRKAIAADALDILVELGGHTEGSRARVLSIRCAPIQISMIGYPDITGLPNIDARMVDEWTDPPGRDSAVPLVRLPRCFLGYTPPNDAPELVPRSLDASMPLVFACFNAAPKVNDETLALWCRVLQAVPSSRLLLKNGSLSSPKVQEHLRSVLTSHQVDSGRLECLTWQTAPASHLAAYSQADIALDTFPYAGTTTTCEALWMGVPVVTLEGLHHASRVGVSLLAAAGLPELVAATPDEFVRVAAELALDHARRGELRRSLRDRLRASPLCDAAGYTRAVEAAFCELWRAKTRTS